MCEEGIQGEVFLKTENQSEALCTELSTCHRAGAGAEPGEGGYPPPHLILSAHQEREQSLGKMHRTHPLTSYTSFHCGLRFSLMTLLWKIWLPTRITP